MDPPLIDSAPAVEEDEWDTDGFVIPSLAVGDNDLRKPEMPEAPDLKASFSKTTKEEVKIYLGPHGAPPSQAKQQEQISTGRKQRFKQKLKEADHRFTTGRENKVENLRQLVGGGGKSSATLPKGSPRDWLDPHCHESQFERYS
ncbi:hypothetical protein QJS04_geneDACA018332 [Acorus gramineus]|uniref:Uncharacterized protein n=1 Tax=Acorus gramineus TaxID=55184 RepID=A0AAV9BCZ8_ACOGR|nr:hypothetical protein QJS04_geneDACA018332 [Acorus gramineus]